MAPVPALSVAVLLVVCVAGVDAHGGSGKSATSASSHACPTSRASCLMRVQCANLGSMVHFGKESSLYGIEFLCDEAWGHQKSRH